MQMIIFETLEMLESKIKSERQADGAVALNSLLEQASGSVIMNIIYGKSLTQVGGEMLRAAHRQLLGALQRVARVVG